MDWQLADAITTALTGCRFDLQAVYSALTEKIINTEISNDLYQLLAQQVF